VLSVTSKKHYFNTAGCRHDCPSRVAVLRITAATKSEKLPLRLLPLRSGCNSQVFCEAVANTDAAQLFYNGFAVIPPVTPPERSGRRAKQAGN
jgi:hypothetical protein